MRHTNFKKKDSSFKVINTIEADVQSWKFTLTDGLTPLGTTTSSPIGDYYSATMLTPNEDCYMLLKQDGQCSMIRVGDPEVLTIAFTGIEGELHDYKQIDMTGFELDSGTLLEIGQGFYYVEPLTLESSFFDLGDGLIKTLALPYAVMNVSEGGSGVSGDGVFTNVGYNMFGFTGERHSYFDLDLGRWVNDELVEAKASDLAKAVCHKYGLVWDDRTDPLWIGNYIQYIRSYEENTGRFRAYTPSITPEDNDANIQLVQTDEGNHTWIRGMSLLLLQTLETIENADGATITFKEQ